MPEGHRTGPVMSAAYLLAWPGMEANTFLDSHRKVRRPGTEDWLWAIGKTLFGAVLFWGAARLLAPDWPLLVGWVGMVGLIFLLHFGFFHLLALLWQLAGVDAQPIMRSPHRAASLSEFWGSRWNLGFRQLSHDLVFQPLRRRTSTATATLAAFALSGFIHDLVISVPAGGGYGLPTAYFLIQGFGVLAERSGVGNTLGLKSGISGRFFMLIATAGPVVLLFHEPFINNVILPFMHAAGAL